MSFMADLIREKQNRKWRLMNKHNETKIQYALRLQSIHVGNHTYGDLKVVDAGNERELFIGSFCSIATDVTFVLQGEHELQCVSTFPFRRKVLLEDISEAKSKGDIVVDSDVWIGQGAKIMSGVHIGQGAVIAAGAIVNKDVSPYEIVGGIPAKTIKYRFQPAVIDYLLTLDYDSLSDEMIAEHIDELYTSLDNLSLDEIRDLYKWFPQKDK